MKQIWNVIFWGLGSVALGLCLGFGVANHADVADENVVLLIAGIAAAVFYVLGIVMSVVIVRQAKSNKNLAVSLQKKDVILRVGETYTVGKRQKVHPGEYKVRAVDESNQTFNLRVNDYVKEYAHNTTLILTEGDKIAACSSNVILR